MAGVGLLALIDDVATLLDDVALYSKAAANKTAAVLGDDLALNAQQVSGVRADRELPIVWAVAKGSLLNKLILVPLALLLSATLPWVITPLLMLGGAYLCYEGFEKLFHQWQQKRHLATQVKPTTDSDSFKSQQAMEAYEKAKIKGAIRTDFILSIEIIVIVLGIVQTADLFTQALVLFLVAGLITIGVYSLVAGIVKFDDAGLALMNKAGPSTWGRVQYRLGVGILRLAPRLMKALSVIGMIAMFLVGGGLLVHGFPLLHHLAEWFIGEHHGLSGFLLSLVFDLAVGLVLGALLVAIVQVVPSLRSKH